MNYENALVRMERDAPSRLAPAPRPLFGWLVLFIGWLVAVSNLYWSGEIFFAADVPLHPRWNIPATSCAIGTALFLWVGAVAFWHRNRPVGLYGELRSNRVARTVTVVALSITVVLASSMTALVTFGRDGDGSTGFRRFAAEKTLHSLRANLMQHHQTQGNLDGIRSGPVPESGLGLDEDAARDMHFGGWELDNFLVEVHGMAPHYTGTVIYAKGKYLPSDKSAPRYKDYGFIFSSVQTGDFEAVDTWAEPDGVPEFVALR